MKLVKEIIQEARVPWNKEWKGDPRSGLVIIPMDMLEAIISAKLEPVQAALAGLFDKSDVTDYNYMEYEAAEQALALLSEDEQELKEES